jgi:hypothetical protein
MINKSAKFWLVLLIIGTIFWLGAVNVRFLIGNELLIFDEFNFRVSIPPDEENVIFKMVANASILIMIAYVITFISALMFTIKSKINVKQNPWYLMCCILFFTFAPVEFYTSYLDLEFVMLFHSNPPNHDELLKLFGERIGFLKGAPWVAILSYYTIIVIAVIQPLRKSHEELEEEKRRTIEHSYVYTYHEEDDLTINENN